jgi:hypothetical protein
MIRTSEIPTRSSASQENLCRTPILPMCAESHGPRRPGPRTEMAEIRFPVLLAAGSTSRPCRERFAIASERRLPRSHPPRARLSVAATPRFQRRPAAGPSLAGRRSALPALALLGVECGLHDEWHLAGDSVSCRSNYGIHRQGRRDYRSSLSGFVPLSLPTRRF